MTDLLITIFYQPFLNALVLVYEGITKIFPGADMGIAVIVFSLLIRFALLPLTLASTQSEEDRLRIGRSYHDLEKKYKHDEPLKFVALKNELIKSNKSTIRFEIINLVIQLSIALILWRVFSNGLTGDDLHLLYSWVPAQTEPFNLTFLGKIDLTQPSILLNLISAALMFLDETLNITFSILPPTREDRIAQFLLPPIVFLYLYTMPAGKKLFIITTLTFSIIFIFFREIHNLRFLKKANT